MGNSNRTNASLEAQLRRACRAEVLNAKPGNVSPGSSFADTTADDFLRSADIVAPILANAGKIGVGAAVLGSVQATVEHVGQNTNLGIVLLLAPLAAVPPSVSLADGIENVLGALTIDDAEQVYQGIAIASPGGLGDASKQDVNHRPTEPLRACMVLAADRDLIAAQYANGYQEVLSEGIALIREAAGWTSQFEKRIAWLATSLMSRHGDSLIARKNGVAISIETQQRAKDVLASGWPFSDAGEEVYDDFDDWLRDEGHRRNPGTTADLVAAILFAAQRNSLCEIDEESGTIIFPDR